MISLYLAISKGHLINLSILVCNPDLFSLNRFMTFEQRYTTIAILDITLNSSR